MDPELEALVQAHALTPEAAAALEVLLVGRHGALATTVIHAYESVDVDRTYLEDSHIEPPPVGEAVGLVARRYEDLGPIASGGMGEVRRVRDVELNRVLAMKLVHGPLVRRPDLLARFLEEAQATAQLQHPNIVPVHDVGALPDGRLWFTMKEVQGRTLGEVNREVHKASGDRWMAGPSGWTFKQVVTSFLAVCHAMAYAHERGVVHRDLKPDNVMVGRLGETVVLDWGLAKLVGRDERPLEDLGTSEVQLRDLLALDEEVVTARGASLRTRIGTVAGTPAYMAPEQARGQVDQIDARTDVYALGAILYELLSGHCPYGNQGPVEVLERVRTGPPAALTPQDGGPPRPAELVDACARAMARDPADRYPSALALATEVQAWLDGARKREQALEITERALDLVRRAADLVEQARTLQARGDAALASVAPWQGEADKRVGWELQDRAAALALEAELRQVDVDQGLHGALRVVPDLPEAHAALALRYRSRHARAEAARDADGLAAADALVRLHMSALPPSHPTRLACATYLEGNGALTLLTSPPGAEVTLYRYEQQQRRLVPVRVRSLGRTPLAGIPLPMGSYLAVLEHPECDPVHYPLEVPRGGHWDGIAPGGTGTQAVALPPAGSLGPDQVYVPAGWFRSGGDPLAAVGLPARRLWCDARVFHRFPVTNRQFLDFLNARVAQGRRDEALRWAPREMAGAVDELGALLYGFDGANFSLRPDAQGDMWLPDWPVFHVDWYGAQAYLQWLSERTGRPWRLPGELEWEKAARGVDGRWYPWGDRHDPSWCCMIDSLAGSPMPVGVGNFPVDCSPFGVRGTAGNVADWCLDRLEGEPEVVDLRVVPPAVSTGASSRAHRVVRGGTWGSSERFTRCALRGREEPANRNAVVGFRGCYEPVF